MQAGELLRWLEAELAEAEGILGQIEKEAFDNQGNMTSRDAVTAMDEQQGWVNAINYLVFSVKRWKLDN
jgi:hypothetical protein